MKNKKIIILAVAAVILLAAFILGVTGVLNLAAETPSGGHDTQIGFLITRESIDDFDMDAWLRDHPDKVESGEEISAEDWAKYGNRLAAKMIRKEVPAEEEGESFTEIDCVFEGVNGLRMIYLPLGGDESTFGPCIVDNGISDVSLDFKTTEAGEEVKMKGKIHFVPRNGDECFYFNPVFQTPDGKVYALPGEFMSMGDAARHGSMGITQSSRETYTSNGKETAVRSLEIAVEIQGMDAPVRSRVLQFSRDNELLKTDEFGPGKLPESMDPLPETDWFLVDTETDSTEKEWRNDRRVFSRQDGFLTAWMSREDGICVGQSCEIRWNGEE